MAVPMLELRKALFGLVAILLILGYASAAYVTVSAINGPFVTDSNVLVAVNIYEGF